MTKEDKYKYEWLDGIIEKTPRSRDKTQFYIQHNLIEFLYSIKAIHKIDDPLIAEGDTFFKSHHRRPDLAYYSKSHFPS